MHHFAKRLVCIVSAVAVTTGCGTTSGVWPVVPKYDRADLIKKEGSFPEANTVAGVKNLSGAWHKLMYEAGRDREVQRVVQNEVLFYGTMMLTGGALMFAKEGKAIWQTLRNIGGAAAFGSDLIGSHYQPGDQSMAFRKAETQMACLIDALQPIPNQNEYDKLFTADEKNKVSEKLQAAESPDIDDLHAAVPRLTLHFIEHQVIPSLRADLQAITLGTPSREELMARLDQFKAKQAQATTAANALPGPASDLKPADEAIKALQKNVERLKEILKKNEGTSQEEELKKLLEQFDKELREKIAQENERTHFNDEQNLKRKLAVKALTTYSSALALCKPA